MALVPFNENGPLSMLTKTSRDFYIGGEKITIKQDWNGSGVAAVVWDASLVLSLFLLNHVGKGLKGKRIIELGAGTGVVGISVARLGASVTITDKEEYIHVTKSNVEANLSNGETFEVKPLDWGKNLHEWDHQEKSWDYIVGADIIYIEETFNDLIFTLKVLARDSRTKVILACRIRYDRDKRFLDLMKEIFSLKLTHYDSSKDIRIFEGVLKTVKEEL